MIRVVIDTNILLACIGRNSQYNLIFQKIIKKNISLCISNSILEEYEEILERRTSHDVAINVIKSLLKLDNVLRFDPRFNWNLIENDPDDDKFVDCYVASNANFLVTNDKHFNLLTNIPFPPINVVGIDDFLEILSNI
jgi:uncharacterized protein